MCACVCSTNKQTRRSPKLRAKITLRATHTHTNTNIETHWSVGVVVGVVEKWGKGRRQRCSP